MTASESGRSPGRLRANWLGSALASRPVRFALIGLIVADVLLCLLHVYATAREIGEMSYYVDADRGYGEFVQYLKYVWMLILVIAWARTRGSWRPAVWLVPFAYFLVDDALQLHERLGHRIGELPLLRDSAWLRTDGIGLGLRASDIGELPVSAAAALVIVVALVTGYVGAQPDVRRRFTVLVGLLLLLAAFGIVVDALHVALMELAWQLDLLLTLTEDGGELVVGSVLVVALLDEVLHGSRADRSGRIAPAST